MKHSILLLTTLSFLFLAHCTSTHKSGPIEAQFSGPKRVNVEAHGTKTAIATQGQYSTQIAANILKQGGNLVDAAVATSFAISVERPQSTGLGGGGFLLFHEGKTGKVYAIDFRERAPLKATENMYLNAKGEVIKNKSLDGIFAVGTPGLVKGLAEVHKRFGKLPWNKLVEPAAHLAETGFPIYEEFYEALLDRKDVLHQDPAARAIFLDANGKVWPMGHQLIQKDLANTLREIAQHGADAFYRGSIAKKISDFSKQSGGLLSAEDLKQYKVHWRKPVRGTFKGYEVYSMPPPSSGGVHVVQFLNMLENDKLSEAGFLSARALHLEASALQSAFVDRAQYLGDPDFVKVPTAGLTSKTYAQSLRQKFNDTRARHADQMRAGQPPDYESLETTHFSMMDSDNNAISSTQTINGWMGAAIVVPDTGIILNNEMDDFSAQVGAQNMFGAVGGKPNAIAPKKTPLSSMSPTILVQNKKPQLAVGAPGGTRIISCVAQTILNVVEFKLPLDQAISSIRIHHQWRPDRILMDPPGASPVVMKELKAMGYKIDLSPVECKVMAVQRINDQFKAYSDPRDIGTAWAR